MSLGDSRTKAGPWMPTLAASLATAMGGTVAIVDGGVDYGTVVRSGGPWLPLSDPARLAGLLALMPSYAEVQWVIVNLGVNDANVLPTQAAFEAAYLYIIDTVHSRWPDARVGLMSGVWRFDVAGANLDTIATWIGNVQAARSSFVFLGPDERVWFEPNEATYSTDGIHWDNTTAGNNAGAAQWLTSLGY